MKNKNKLIYFIFAILFFFVIIYSEKNKQYGEITNLNFKHDEAQINFFKKLAKEIQEQTKDSSKEIIPFSITNGELYIEK